MATATFSGLASGIDSASLIDSIIEARQEVNTLREEEIEGLESENDALDELNTKFLALDDLVDKYRTSNGGGVGKVGNSTDATVATATAGSNAINASYAINVSQLAKTATASFNNSYSSADSVASTNSGDVVITVGTGSSQVTVTAAVTGGTTTLTELAALINADSNANGRVTASVVNIGTEASPDYRLMMNTLESGTDEGTIAISTVPTGDAMTELSSVTYDQALNAQFSIQGISGTISRATNSISDVISGVTFNLVDTGSTTISIANDADTTSADLEEIVSAYNDIVTYINENDTIEQDSTSDDGENIYGSLAKCRTDNDFITAFRSALFGASSENGTAVGGMSQMGISTNRDGTLEFDADEFAEAVKNDWVGVSEVLNSFADSVSGVSGVIYQYTKLDGYIDIAQSANDTEIDNLNDSIDQLDRRLEKLRTQLETQFTALESTTADLQSQQSQLESILGS